MRKNVDVFMAWTGCEVMKKTIEELTAEQIVENVYLLAGDADVLPLSFEKM